MTAGKADIWMPLYIGDYLADTMHLSTEQHGAYLLLLFHLWRRGILPDDDATLAQITGMAKGAWNNNRAVLAEFFEVRDEQWHQGRLERERARSTAKQQNYSSRAKAAANRRWGHASSNADSMLNDAQSQSQSESELFPNLSFTKSGPDQRHTPFRQLLAAYWNAKNHASPEMPWQGRDAKALSDFLAACPNLSEAQFRMMLDNRAKSAVAHGDRVYLWIGNLTRFQEEITVYNKPASAGGGSASRAEINRNSVVSAVDGAIALSRQYAARAGEAGPEQAGFDDAGMPFADGPGLDGRSLALSRNGNHRMAAGDAAHGQAGTDGSLPHCAATAPAGGADGDGRREEMTRL